MLTSSDQHRLRQVIHACALEDDLRQFAHGIATQVGQRGLICSGGQKARISLARALYSACEVGQEIPEELYGAVARVLAFVMSLKRRGAALGVHRLAS